MAGSGETVTYRELDERSNQGAQLFRTLGLTTGDGIAIFLENHPRYYESCGRRSARVCALPASRRS
jgi:long-chain acyl-CoA synthetase